MPAGLWAALALSFGCSEPPTPEGPSAPPGMVWVPGGQFTMGSDSPDARPDEGPSHLVETDGFWIDETEVTNAQFRAFVAATGYLTTAEQTPKWEDLREQVPPGTPEPPPGVLVPGSLVFTPPAHAVDLRNVGLWWTWTPDASWQHPFGPDSNIKNGDLKNRDDEPVTHVSWDDAVAYATWAGKALPTEAQWERAARMGQDGAPYIWGSELEPDGKHMANIWQGTFPHFNSGVDGFLGIAPVRSFPPNAIGLYDMAGNVWEWTADQFRADAYETRVSSMTPGTCCSNPIGPTSSADPRNPFAKDSRVQKGGSFLCNASYCSSYRPSAKMAATPDSALSHLGFRCITTPALWAKGTAR